MRPFTLPALLLAVATLASAAPAAEDKPAATTAAPGAAVKSTNAVPDVVIAKTKSWEIKRSALDAAIASLKDRAERSGHEISPDDLRTLEGEAFDHLMMVQLLQAKAGDAEKAKGKETVEEYFKMIKGQLGEDKMAEMLKSRGTTLEESKARLLQEAVAEAVLMARAGEQLVDRPESVRASHILLLTQDESQAELSDDAKKAKLKKMQGILKRARDGEDFAKLAKENSEDPGSKDKGGEYLFGHGEMVPEFEKAAFALKTNEVSDIVTTKYGYHIIKLSEKIPAQRVQLSKLTPEVRDTMEQQVVEKLIPAYFAELKKETPVDILDDKLKALEAELATRPLKPEPQPDAPKADPAK